MKFAVTVFNTERVSYEKIKDVGHTKIFNDTDSLKDIIEWGNSIRAKTYDGPKTVDITELRFSKLCE
jgi:hypothetical protein